MSDHSIQPDLQVTISHPSPSYTVTGLVILDDNITLMNQETLQQLQIPDV